MSTVKLKARGLTHVGQVRSVNQDSFLCDEGQSLFIVADGMGGHAGGEIASQLCIKMVVDYLKEHDGPFREFDNDGQTAKILTVLAASINHASAKIYEYALEEPSLKGMGTTATVVKLVGKRAYCAHVGDSRFYLVRNEFLYQITYDHSLVNEQVRAGIITPEEAEFHHLKNVITRSVGYQEEEDVDTTSVDLEAGDILVLCSDGLHGKVSDKEISKTTRQKGLLAVNKLIDLANERGGEDNITVVMLELDPLAGGPG